MPPNLLSQVYAWSAVVSAAATVATFATGILFFYVSPAFGKWNDVSSVFQTLFMLPLAAMFAQLAPGGVRAAALLAALAGVAGMLIVAYGQSLLVLGHIDFQASMRFFPAGAAIGVWLIVVSWMGATVGLLPSALAWVGVGAGAGYVLTVVGFLAGGQDHWLFYLGGLALGIAYPVWAIWLGRLIWSGMMV